MGKNKRDNRPLKVLGINSSDIYSQRFNGISIIEDLHNEGIEYELLSDIHMRKNGISITPKLFRYLKDFLTLLERKTGFQSRFYFWTFALRFRRSFQEAQVVHYHILHNSFFRLESLKYLTKKKSSVWTFHDLWIATGHCIQPIDCSRFGDGCGKCPFLQRSIPVSRDRTSHEFYRKYNLIKKINAQYIVSTEWMKARILTTLPIESENLHVIPFGVDAEIFEPVSLETKKQYRQNYGISQEAFVIFINAHNDEIKGIEIVKELIKHSENEAIKFLILDESKFFVTSEDVHSFPRITAQQEIIKLIQICDVVLIPSLAESFSMLTLESMSCGLPVITLKDSAAYEVAGEDSNMAFSKVSAVLDILMIIQRLKSNAQYITEVGQKNRARAIDKFSKEQYVEKLSNLYRNNSGN